MNIEEINSELEKCKKSPYYFAVKYLKIKNTPYSEDMVDFYTHLSEEEFNKQFENYDNRRVKG